MVDDQRESVCVCVWHLNEDMSCTDKDMLSCLHHASQVPTLMYEYDTKQLSRGMARLTGQVRVLRIHCVCCVYRCIFAAFLYVR